MTCPLNRCDGSGWIADVGEAWCGRPVSSHEPCPCHGWRRVEEATDEGRNGVRLVWHPKVGILAGYLTCVGSWYDGYGNRLDPQPTHYFPRPLPPELPETTERGETT